MGEDELANALIESFRDDNHKVDIEVEAHYNHYGDRGVADLFVRDRHKTSDGSWPVVSEQVYELKSDVAIESVTGANEIIRQFNRMRRYFFKDEDRHKKGADWSQTTFELCFLPTETALLHVWDNREQYRSCLEKDHDGERTIISFRPAADDILPFHATALWDDKISVEHVHENSDLSEQFRNLAVDLASEK